MDSSNKFKTNPHIKEDLELLNKSKAYSDWLFSLVLPYIGERVLEIGSGIGNYTEKLLGRQLIWATDNDPLYVKHLENKFRQYSQVRTRQVDLTRITPEIQNLFCVENIDTVILMNVLEHVGNDLEALNNIKGLLMSPGHIIVIVPALEWLYSPLDKAYGHHKRYNRKDIRNMAERLNLELKVCNYFNFTGIFGWLLNSKFLGKRYLPKNQTRIFERFVPLIRFLEEKIFHPPVGLSLLAVFFKR